MISRGVKFVFYKSLLNLSYLQSVYYELKKKQKQIKQVLVKTKKKWNFFHSFFFFIFTIYNNI